MLNAVLLPDLLKQTRESISDYVSAIHSAQGFKKMSKQDIDVQVLDQLEDLDKNRTIAHNALIAQLRAFERAAAKAGIDTSWKDVIQLSESNFDRTRIQYFAEHVADHLARIGMRS